MPASPPDPIDDRTAIMLAACANDLCTLFDVLLSGAPVDQQDSRRWTALTYACSYGHYEIAQQLLDSGADPNIHESYAMVDTPLSLAAQGGHFSLVRLLIAHGADPNCYAGISAPAPKSTPAATAITPSPNSSLPRRQTTSQLSVTAFFASLHLKKATSIPQ